MARNGVGKKRKGATPPVPARPRETGEKRAGRRFAAAAAVVLAAAALFALAHYLLSRGRRGPIVLVSIDTLRADHLPAYGYPKIATPALDALARDGVVFEACYTHAPLTLPAHASLLTGLLPPEHGVRNNIGFRLAEGTPTLASELKKAGWATGGAVSAAVLRAGTGIARGFDWYDDAFEATGPEVRTTEVQRDGSETLKRALAWLAERSRASGGEPPFLFLHLYEPHAPYAPPPRYRGNGISPYDGEVMYSDEIFGRLVDGMRSLGLWDRSLVVLLSDHGEGLGDHGEEDHGVFLYREVTRVPLVVRLPGGESGGRRVAAPAQLIDIVPTLRDWAGLPPRSELRGTSLLGALRGAALPDDRRVYAESLYGRLHFGWKELFSLTDARFSFILAPRPELYDLAKDPAELRDLLSGGAPTPEAATERDRLHRALRALSGQAAPKAPNPVDEEEVAKLRALGYVGSPTLDPAQDETAPDPKDRIGDLALYRKATRLKAAGFHALAVADLERVVASSPRMIDAWDELAEEYRRLGDDARAVAALRKGLEVAPSRSEAHFALADLLVRLGRLDEARREVDAVASRRPGEAAIRRAFIEVAAGNPEAARASAARASAEVPAAEPYVEGLLAHGRGEHAAAIPLLRRALEAAAGRSPRLLPRVHDLLGSSLVAEAARTADGALRVRLLQEAERQLRIELAFEPTNADAVRSLCDVHVLAGAPEMLGRELELFARGNPSAATFRLGAAILSRAGRSEDAARWSLRARAGAAP